MYPMPQPDQSNYQAKMIVNMVVVVFLVIGLLMVMQYFNFIYLRDVPVMGGWLMGIYERIFGVPQVLMLHGDDSMGDWVALRDRLSANMMFASQDLDAREFDSGSGIISLLKQYALVIVEDVKTLDKDKLASIDEYVRGGGNLIWVGDAGTVGTVEYEGFVIKNQTGWLRPIVCVDKFAMTACNCTMNASSNCKFLPADHGGGTGQKQIEFNNLLGLTYIENVPGIAPQIRIVDRNHWAAVGIKRTFILANVTSITSVANAMETALVANVNASNKLYPGIIVNDLPGTWGNIVYFAYPAEETPEILMPIIERLRY